MHVGVNEPVFRLVSDNAGDVSAARGDVEHQVHGIAGLPVHFACGPPVIRCPSLDLRQHRIRGFDEVVLRTLSEVHSLERIAAR